MLLKTIKMSMLFISVGDAPELVEPLSDLTVIGPKEAVLECSIKSGKPQAEIKW